MQKQNIFQNKEEGNHDAIQCHARINDSNDDDKDQFYERLQSIIAKCAGKDLYILMEDLNVKFGVDNTEHHGTTQTDWEKRARMATDSQMYVQSKNDYRWYYYIHPQTHTRSYMCLTGL